MALSSLSHNFHSCETIIVQGAHRARAVPRVKHSLCTSKSNSKQIQRFRTHILATREHVVVVGGGNSCGYFCKRFVDAIQNGEIKKEDAPKVTIVSAELTPPYERPALTKAFLHPDHPVRPPGFNVSVAGGGQNQTLEWYKENDIDLILGERVVAGDFDNKTVTTSSSWSGAGRTLEYDKLVVACGVQARTMPEELGGLMPGVHYVRSEQDAAELYESLESKARQVVVIGGGYIGMECAAAISAWDIPVTMIFGETNLMPRLMTKTIAKFYEGLYKENGIDIRPDEMLWYIDSGMGTDVRSVVVRRGEGNEPGSVKVLQCDTVVIGMGIDIGGTTLGPFRTFTDIKAIGDEGVDPMELAALSDSFEGVGGIETDGFFRVKSPKAHNSVYAIGDLAAFPLKLDDNKMTRVEHVDHARRSGMLCAEDLLGLNPEPYDYMPYFYSRTFEHEGSKRRVHWVFYGLQEKCSQGVVVVGDFNPRLAGFWLEDDRCYGIFLESGTPEEIAALPEVARKQPKVDIAKLKAAKTVDEALELIGVYDEAKIAA